MKNVEVSAAIITSGHKVFVTKRGYGEFKGGWEFPGGKLEQGESPEECLLREIKEELDANIFIESFLKTIDYDYPSFHLKMHCFICKVEEGSHLALLEHEDGRFVDADELGDVGFLPADFSLIEDIKAYFDKRMSINRKS